MYTSLDQTLHCVVSNTMLQCSEEFYKKVCVQYSSAGKVFGKFKVLQMDSFELWESYTKNDEIF